MERAGRSMCIGSVPRAACRMLLAAATAATTLVAVAAAIVLCEWGGFARVETAGGQE